MDTKSGNISKSYAMDYMVVMIVVILILLILSLVVSLTSTSKALRTIDELTPYTPNAQTISVPTISSNKAKDKITETSVQIAENNPKLNNDELYKDYLEQNIVYSKGVFWTDIVIYYSVDSEKMIHLYYKNISEYEKIKGQLELAGFLVKDTDTNTSSNNSTQ